MKHEPFASVFAAFFPFIYLGVVISGIILYLIVHSIHQTETWNNGYCECGGKWVYEQAIGHYTDTNYIYQCDKCGRIYKFDKLR